MQKLCGIVLVVRCIEFSRRYFPLEVHINYVNIMTVLASFHFSTRIHKIAAAEFCLYAAKDNK